MTQVELAQRIRVPYVRVNELVNGERRVTPSTALSLAQAFGTSPEFWLNGQLAPDLYLAINDKQELKEVEKIEPVLHQTSVLPSDRSRSSPMVIIRENDHEEVVRLSSACKSSPPGAVRSCPRSFCFPAPSTPLWRGRCCG